MRSAILLAFVALYGCASAPGYRSSSVRTPASFRGTTDDSHVAAPAPDGPQPVAPSPEGPHPLSPSPPGSGGTKEEAAVSLAYWGQLGGTPPTRQLGEVRRGNLDVPASR